MTGHSRSGEKKKKEKKWNLLLPNGLILCEPGSSLSKGARGIQRHSAPCSRSWWSPQDRVNYLPSLLSLLCPLQPPQGDSGAFPELFLKSTTAGLLLPWTPGCRGSTLPPFCWPWPSPAPCAAPGVFCVWTPSSGPHTQPVPAHINYIWVSHWNTRLHQSSSSTCL